MKFAFFGYDHTLDIAERLVEDGHQLMHIFSFPCDNVFAHNTNTHTFAQISAIEITERPIQKTDIDSLITQGCELFFCASYPHKIPPIPEDKAYGLNLHPTLLPKGRGIMPVPYIMMKEPNAAGFTIHKLAQSFDTGDIIYQQKTPISPYTDIETLLAKMALHAPKAASKVITNLDEYWNNAKPQDNSAASFYHAPTTAMRTIDPSTHIEKTLRQGKAFGRYGLSLSLEGKELSVFNLSGWTEIHHHPIGEVIKKSPRSILIAATGGFILIKEYSVN